MVHIEDLPNELILIIWNKLNKIDVLYSFLNVNKRFHKLVLDKTYTRSIDLLKHNGEKENNGSLSNNVLNQFCLNILPQIHYIIEELIVESDSVERILAIGQYPRLCKLTLVNLTQELARQIFSDLDFGENVTPMYPKLMFNNSSANSYFSSTILNLRIDVRALDVCQLLLDGRLSQLRTFIVRIHLHCSSTLPINNTILPHLKCFSFTTYQVICYDTFVRLLRRMVYLEQLTLYFRAFNRSKFIDGLDLSNDILDHMPQLQTFDFNIISPTNVVIRIDNEVHENMRRSFLSRKFGQVGFYFQQDWGGKTPAHIYSLPYKLSFMYSLTHAFPGGLFPTVRSISLVDFFYTFEYDTYDRITRSFPYLIELIILNITPRRYRSPYDLNENHQELPIIVFPHLKFLQIESASIHTAEQFLIDTRTLAPRLTHLTMSYSDLQDVTNYFTRQATRRTCANIKYLKFYSTQLVHCNEFYNYFPSLID